MSIVVVYNLRSGSVIDLAGLKHQFKEASLSVDRYVEFADDYERRLTPYVKKGAYIAAIGGDGTIGAIAGLVAGTDAVLIPLPGGTLNHFTGDMGVPQSLDDALKGLRFTKPQMVDVATVNGTVFLNNSSIGLYPTALKIRKSLEPRIGKWPAALCAAVHSFTRLHIYKIEINGRRYRSPFVFIGNNRYDLDDLGFTQRVHLNKGVLSVFIADTQSRVRLVVIALYLLFGKSKGLKDFHEFHLTELDVRARRSTIYLSHDGEASRMTVPLHYSIQPASLKILRANTER